MRTDLLDAKAAVDWAEAQLDILQERIVAWRRDDPYAISIDADSKPGKKLYRMTKVKPLPRVVSAEAGAILHSIRSSLDLLACALAARNRYPASTSTYFPIWKSKADFDDPTTEQGKAVLKKIKRLSQPDQAVIKNLNPYPGGNDPLVALHNLDVARKHRRLLNAFVEPGGLGFIRASDKSATFTGNRSFEENTVLAWTEATEPDGKVSFFLHVTLNETGFADAVDLRAPLRDFARLANSIIDLFA
jgi:hypothetical protein